VPSALEDLRERLAGIEDLRTLASLASWDQMVMMPPRGAGARAEQAATLGRLVHDRFTDPETARLLDAAAATVDLADPDDDGAALVRVTRRDFDKAVRVPGELRAEMARAAALGHEAWARAREDDDFAAFLPALERNLDLVRRYAACFPDAANPYDPLLDDYEPGATAAEVSARFDEVRAGLVPLIAAITERGEVLDGSPLEGDFDVGAQRALVGRVLRELGTDDEGWRLDVAVHPFATGLGRDDVRITTRYEVARPATALYGAIHEFGHGLYERQVASELQRSPLGSGVSLGIHESQSRLWENVVGRSLPFSAWLAPRLAEAFPDAFAALDTDTLHRAVNRVAPSLVRVEADEATYPLHIVLRFEIERDLLAGNLAPRELPARWNAGMHDLLGVEVPDDRLGVLQDVHWSEGLVGYFPTYLLGTAIAAQLWEAVLRDLPTVEEGLAAGEFAPLRDWLGDRIHRHGRKLLPAELLERATGSPLDVAPYLRYLNRKYGALYGLAAT